MTLSSHQISAIRQMYENGKKLSEIAEATGASNSTITKYTRGLYRTPELPKLDSDERWAPVECVTGSYFVSNYGRVFSFGNGGHCWLLSPHASGKGYLSVVLSAPSGARAYKVHRLVAVAFVDGRTPERNQVNHIDGDKKNNRADNLEWASQSENVRHSIYALGQKGTAHRRFTPDQGRAIRTDPRGCKKLAKAYGCGKTTILNIRNGVSYTDVV